jgi:hypothetical protein
MIDEWFDRSYQQGRSELHGCVDRLIVRIRSVARSARDKDPSPIKPEGVFKCDYGSSSLPCSRRS